MDFTTITHSLAFWIGATTLALLLWSIRVLASLRGRGDIRITIDGRTFQIPAWAFAEAVQQFTLAEQATIAEGGEYEIALHRAEQALKAAKRSTPVARRAARQALKEALSAFARAQKDAQIAYANALRRWLLSSNGQNWLQSQGLRFP
jgi:hypothetical protein